MPALVPVREYQPLDPYHHIADNGPIIDIETNLSIINEVVDSNNQILTDAAGIQANLADRLSVALNPNGSLITQAVDNAMHSIAAHLDGGGFVRMTLDERDKLAAIADGATNIEIQVHTLSTTALFDNGIINFLNSDSVAWRVDSNNAVYADVQFPVTARHRHYYDTMPVPLVPLSPDYQNYTTTSVATAYVAGSLRVYINGTKISHFDNTPGDPPDVSFPRISGPTVTWIPMNYQEDTGSIVSGIVTSGKFALSAPITATDRIMIEFDISLD